MEGGQPMHGLPTGVEQGTIASTAEYAPPDDADGVVTTDGQNGHGGRNVPAGRVAGQLLSADVEMPGQVVDAVEQSEASAHDG